MNNCPEFKTKQDDDNHEYPASIHTTGTKNQWIRETKTLLRDCEHNLVTLLYTLTGIVSIEIEAATQEHI